MEGSDDEIWKGVMMKYGRVAIEKNEEMKRTNEPSIKLCCLLLTAFYVSLHRSIDPGAFIKNLYENCLFSSLISFLSLDSEL